SSRLLPLRSTLAPYPAAASCFPGETQTGMTMVAGIPAIPAATATPCAWLPAEAAITPMGPIESFRDRIRFVAPLTLQDPAFCIVSSLRYTPAPVLSENVGEYNRGVRMIFPGSGAAASLIDAMETMGRDLESGII